MPHDPSEGYIYAIRVEDGSRVKVGYSHNPHERLAALEQTMRQHLVLVHAIRVTRPYFVEGLLHNLLGPLRLDGEWFALDTSILTIFPGLVHQAREMMVARPFEKLDKEIP